MAKTVVIRVDPERSSLEVESGRLFLGAVTRVKIDGWLPNSGCEPVLTMFPHDRATPLAQSGQKDGALVLDLTGAALRRAFHCAPARHQFALYLNQRDGSGKYLPDVEAVGTVFVDWSPEVFDVESGEVATLQGPPGNPGADGLSAYQLAVANGYSGTLEQWLESLKGEPGRDGVPGADGSDGIDGLSAFGVAVKNGFKGTEAEWLASLKGPPGEDGKDGVRKVNGMDGDVVLTGGDIPISAVPGSTDVSAEILAVANSVGAVSVALGDHVNLRNNPHGVTANDVGAYTKAETDARLAAAVASTVEISGEYEDGTPFSFEVLKKVK